MGGAWREESANGDGEGRGVRPVEGGAARSGRGGAGIGPGSGSEWGGAGRAVRVGVQIWGGRILGRGAIAA